MVFTSVLFQMQNRWMADASVQERVQSWLIDWRILLVVAVALGGNSFGAIERDILDTEQRRHSCVPTH